MRLKIVIRKALIALLVASVLVIPALMTSAEAQLYGSQFSQISPGSYSSQQYPYSGGLYGQYGQQSGLLPQSSCPPGYYYDTYSRQCLPVQQQPYPYGGPQTCPAGYYFDQYRLQCVPYMTAQSYGY